jgi:N-acetylglutamate synthase-like GNAT family acetyltransferase
MELRIEYLADHPEHLPRLAVWHHEYFSVYNPVASLEGRIRKLESRSRKGAIPTTVVALLADKLVGSASLIEHDMESRQDLSPWISTVYVHPDYRRRGIGTRLVKHLEGVAERLGFERLYLFTPDMRPFYETFGWSVLEETQHRGRPTTIMEKRLAASSPWGY